MKRDSTLPSSFHPRLPSAAGKPGPWGKPSAARSRVLLQRRKQAAKKPLPAKKQNKRHLVSNIGRRYFTNSRSRHVPAGLSMRRPGCRGDSGRPGLLSAAHRELDSSTLGRSPIRAAPSPHVPLTAERTIQAKTCFPGLTPPIQAVSHRPSPHRPFGGGRTSRPGRKSKKRKTPILGFCSRGTLSLEQ